MGSRDSDTPTGGVASAHLPGVRVGEAVGEPVEIVSRPDPVAAFAAAARSGERLALPTSGTSGVTRTVVRTIRSWSESFPTISELTGLTAESRLWLSGPLSATMNLFAAVHADWAGARRTAKLPEASHVHCTPSRLRAVLADGTDLAGRMVVVAGDTLDPGLRARAERAGASVAHYYGAAELSFVAWGRDRDDLRPFPGVDVDIREGEIWVRSPYLADGYLNSSAGPLRTDADGFATVGDRGYLDAGRLRVHGRPDAILTGGATVLIADVEAALRPAVHGQLAVIGLPHPRLGQVVAAVLTDRADREPARRAAALLGSGRPRRWFCLPDLPLTEHGKLDRPELALRLAAEFRESDP